MTIESVSLLFLTLTKHFVYLKGEVFLYSLQCHYLPWTNLLFFTAKSEKIQNNNSLTNNGLTKNGPMRTIDNYVIKSLIIREEEVKPGCFFLQLDGGSTYN